jgi:hypothetical protein
MAVDAGVSRLIRGRPSFCHRLEGAGSFAPFRGGAYDEAVRCETITRHFCHEKGPDMSILGTRRRWLGAAGVAAVMAAAGGAAVAHADRGPARGQFVLTETTTARASVDVDGSGTSTPGDAFIFHSVLTNGAGTPVGSVDGHCVVLLGGRTLCHSVATLARGTLSTTFVAAAGSATLQISIDGGTGRFDRSRGQITATRATSTAFREVFDIDR